LDVWRKCLSLPKAKNIRVLEPRGPEIISFRLQKSPLMRRGTFINREALNIQKEAEKQKKIRGRGRRGLSQKGGGGGGTSGGYCRQRSIKRREGVGLVKEKGVLFKKSSAGEEERDFIAGGGG